MASRRSIGFPLTLGIVLTLVALALAVGWQILVFSDAGIVARGFSTVDWILFILGAVSFGLIISGLLWLCLWLQM